MDITEKTAIDVVKMHSNGRLQVPVEIRNDLELKDGDKILWYRDSSRRYFIEKVSKTYGTRYP